MKPIFLKASFLVLTLPLLNGCVAAIIPVVASGALLGKEQLGSDDDAPREGVVAVGDSSAAEPVETTTPAPILAPTPVAVLDEPIVEVQVAEIPVEELPAAARAETTPIAPAPNFTTRPELPAEKPVEIATVPASEPVGVPQPSVNASGPTDFRAYNALYSYVESQARRDPISSPRQSATLAVPGALSPARVDCSIRPPAVLLDLDQEDAAIDPAIKPRANPALARILASMRLQEIEVFWISKQPAVAAGGIRKALIASGLDPQGRDGLLLMRRADDRKQTRRKELSETHCLLAIGGDRRADFDELYLYLKDPSSAQPLEELIGAGWFLTPLPLTEG